MDNREVACILFTILLMTTLLGFPALSLGLREQCPLFSREEGSQSKAKIIVNSDLRINCRYMNHFLQLLVFHFLSFPLFSKFVS